MPIILPANSASSGGFNVDNSVRLDSASSAYLSRAGQGNSNQRTMTISVWVKRSKLGADQGLLNVGGSSYYSQLYFSSDDKLVLKNVFNGSGAGNYTTNRVFRDISSWYHIVAAIDTTQGTAGNRFKIYVNGVQETSFSTSDNPGSNQTLEFGSNTTHEIGNSPGYYGGYMCEYIYLDGTQATPTSFGEFDDDSGIWKPIEDVDGLTFGTVGFYLDFEDSSNLGNTVNGVTDFTSNNLAAVDQSTDTCTNNLATFNSLAYGTGGTAASFAEGNLEIIRGSASWRTAPATIGLTQGKWYYEVKAGTIAGSGSQKLIQVGTVSESGIYNCIDSYHESTTYSYAYHWSGQKYVNNSASSFGSAITTGDIVMIALDLDNNYIYAGLNGTWQNSGNPASGGSGTGALSALQSGQTYFPTVSVYDSAHEINFGSPNFTISSGNSDGNGYGNFEYAVPGSYYSINTKNLAEYG
tara:strand:- start:1118 stop:2515 length:1398 start_codon:yes stop_codon:yes gene_type:complete